MPLLCILLKGEFWNLPWWPTGKDCASTVGGAGSIPDQETKIPYAEWHGRKVKKISVFQFMQNELQ